jgi:Co/Zn/Cd efflux system component
MILTVRKPLPEDHLRRALRLVAVLNLAYFFVEFVVALAIGSVSPFADSIDFSRTPRSNCLILVSLGWSTRWLAHVGRPSGILLATVIATLCTAWHTFLSPVPVGTIAAIADGRRGVRH